MEEGVAVPIDLAERVPGSELAGVLSDIELSSVNGYELVDVIVAQARQVAHEQARLHEMIAELAHVPTTIDGAAGPGAPVLRTECPEESAAEELRMALCWTRRYAEHQAGIALRLVDDLPHVHEALKAGRIQVRVAELIADHTFHLEAAAAAEVADRVLDDIEKVATDSDGFGGLTTGQVRERLRRHCVEADPDSAAKRYKRGVEHRRLVGELNDDGTTTLLAGQLPTERAIRVKARIDQIAASLKRAGDDAGRTLDQLRADTFLDLLEGVDPYARRAADSEAGKQTSSPSGGVEVVIPFDTLTRASEQPGELVGWGPVLADVARQVAERQRDGRWTYTIVDPRTGELLDQVLICRRPPAEVARLVRARDRTCRHPGCRAPAHRCDLDHTIPVAEGGATHEANLGPHCRHDHRLKHQPGWTVRQPTPGTFTWTTPTGHRHTARPPQVNGTRLRQ